MEVQRIPKRTVSVIEPQKSILVDKEKYHQKRVAAYCRVSTDSEEQLTSYQNQMRVYTEMIAANKEWEFAGLYADEGISGTRADKRPEFQRMIRDCQNGKIDYIITKSVSRFARNTTQLLEAVRELRDLGIEVVFENENIHTFQPTSEIFLTIAATIAENDLEVDSARQRWSIQHRCENGWISVGSGLFGLKLTADNELEIVTEEAAVIRYIYESYVDGGIGSKRIADALNAAGVQSRNGYPWDAKHIIGLLRNEKYKGDVIMGKSVRHFGEYHKNPNAEYAPRYYMEGTHEAIVDKDMWEAAQRILEERSRNHCRTRIAHSFTGMIECGCCGKNYLHKVNNSQCKWQTDIWACRTYLRDGKKACGNSRIKDTVLKEKFISAYNEFIERRPQGDSMVALQEVLEDLRQQEQELAELMMQRLITKAAYEEERKSVKMQITDISEKISERRAKRVPESEYVPITEFSEEKTKRFLSKVVVTMFTVTFVFYNGAKITRTYDNGQPGNKVGWNKKKEES